MAAVDAPAAHRQIWVVESLEFGLILRAANYVYKGAGGPRRPVHLESYRPSL